MPISELRIYREVCSLKNMLEIKSERGEVISKKVLMEVLGHLHSCFVAIERRAK